MGAKRSPYYMRQNNSMTGFLAVQGHTFINLVLAPGSGLVSGFLDGSRSTRFIPCAPQHLGTCLVFLFCLLRVSCTIFGVEHSNRSGYNKAYRS